MTKMQFDLLELLDNFGYDIFTIDMIRQHNSFTEKELAQVLFSLTQSGILVKIERGKYIRSNFSDEFVIGNFLAPDGGIAYWSALNSHGLTEQFPNVIFVQTAKRRGELTFRNLRYRFVKVDARKLAGYKELGYGNHRYKMSDIEKTIADCFDLPQHAGWYHETIKAFNNAKINPNKLIRYCKILDNASATKRLGFLCELLQKPNMDSFVSYALSLTKESYSLFEIAGEKTGEYNKKWKLIINLPANEILEIANS